LSLTNPRATTLFFLPPPLSSSLSSSHPLSLRLSLCLSLSASLSLFVNMTQWLVALVVVSLALCGSVVSAFYEGKSPVVSLSGATFDSAIFGSEVILP